MAMTVASRYAVLSLDEDDDYSTRKKKSPNKKMVEAKPNNTTSIKSDTNFKRKKKNNPQPQNVKSRNKSTNSGGNNKKKQNASVEQWEEWKQKDAQFIEGNYEDELSQAILLSKLDYEQKKHFYEPVTKTDEQKKGGKKNKKNLKVIHELSSPGRKNNKDDFHSFDLDKGNLKVKVSNESEEKEKDNRVDIVQLENKVPPRETFSQEALTIAQYEDTIEKRDKEILQLKDEIEKLKGKLHNVKSRNKKLCQIIANGEMKDKAEVLMEVERLQTVRDELSSEVVSLHAQLEQERSKVRALTANEHKSKDKNKRRNMISADAAQ